MNILEYMSVNNMTQEQFAEKIGKTQATVSHYINGQRSIQAETAVAIEKATEGVVTREELRPDVFLRKK